MSTNITKIISQAVEAAKSAPEHLQEVAFSKAFDFLSGQSAGQATDVKPEIKTSKTAKTRGSKPQPNQNTLESLDRTAHPEITHSRTALENALLLLRAVRKDLGIDGLSAAEIAKVLTEKFRCRISRQAVSMALNDAGAYVNRVKEGHKVLFQIMGPGTDFLLSLGSESESPSTNKVTKKKTSKTTAKKKPKAKTTKVAKSSLRKVSPGTAIGTLYESGFFSSPRTIKSIIEELQLNQGRTFKSNEMSPVLLRYLRDDKLKRQKNSDNQFEYEQP